MSPVTTISEIGKHDGQTVTVRGWLYNLRESGKLLFPIFRDGSGVIQGVVPKNAVSPEVFDAIKGLTQESSVIVEGKVRADKRAPGGYELDVSGTTTGLLVKGGGSNEAADVTPAPEYFTYFSNAPWTFTHGEAISAVTNVNRYVKVTNPDGTSAVLKYATNDGIKLTLPVSSVQTVSGSTATTLVVGALIEECNATGIVFVGHIGLAAQAIVTGAGSIKGTNGASGRRTVQETEHQLNYAVGIEYAWGCEAFKRPDGVYPGFIYLETAMPSMAA